MGPEEWTGLRYSETVVEVVKGSLYYRILIVCDARVYLFPLGKVKTVGNEVRRRPLRAPIELTQVRLLTKAEKQNPVFEVRRPERGGVPCRVAERVAGG